MSLPIESPDPIKDTDRTAATLEWAQRRRELGTPSAFSVSASLWTVEAEAWNKTVLVTGEGVTSVVLPAGDEVPAGFYTLLVATGAGGIAVDADAVTVLGNEPGLSAAQNGSLYVEKVDDEDNWIVIGGS